MTIRDRIIRLPKERMEGRDDDLDLSFTASGPVSVAAIAPAAKAWCWEGNVVQAVAAHLEGQGWTIEAIANTATGEFDVYTRLLARLDGSIRQLGLMVLLVPESGAVEIVVEGRRIPRT